MLSQIGNEHIFDKIELLISTHSHDVISTLQMNSLS